MIVPKSNPRKCNPGKIVRLTVRMRLIESSQAPLAQVVEASRDAQSREALEPVCVVRWFL